MGPFVLALHDDPAWEMGDADGSFYLVDVLASRTSCAERVDPQILVFDRDVDILAQLRIHEDGRKRSVPPLVGVEWGNTYQAMDAGFCFQVPIGIGSGD